MANLILKSPLDGWAMSIEQIPDPVFAQRMAGDGLGIDPTGNVLHAPCAGVVTFVGGHSHALSLRTEAGADILLHVGIDTVALAGAGFEPLVTDGELVASGQALLRFDLDLIARRAPSAVTPVLLVAGGKLLRTNVDCLVAVGDFLMEVIVDANAGDDRGEIDADLGDLSETQHPAISRRFAVPFAHGLHARPASQLVATLRPFSARVSLSARGGRANARSSVALMALGVEHDELVEVSAVGVDADAALDAVAALLASAMVAPPASHDQQVMVADLAVQRMSGLIASRGLALGPAVLLQHATIEIAEAAGDPSQEYARLSAAIEQVRAQILSLAGSQQGAQQTILEAHAELVDDPELLEQARRNIAGGSSGGHGWRLAIASSVRALERLDNARMRERIADLRDIELQVLGMLTGKATHAQEQLPDSAIVLADELLPSQLFALDRERLAGICTARGGPTSHVAIIAAALGLPALVAVGPQLLNIAPGCMVLLDAEQGFIETAPDARQQACVAEALACREQQRVADLAMAAASSTTRDGLRVRVCANLGTADEVSAAVARGADGCGLLRTEFLFLQRQSPPDEHEQFEEYRKVLDLLASRPLTIRTMDIGGDKPIPYLSLPTEDNPALGLRGLRTSLARPEMLRSQLRAILRLDSPGTCRVMLPMVTDVGEIRVVRALLQQCADELGISDLPQLGAMIETPASALLADQLLREADFLSIGTNDLSQYVLAMDRGHPILASRLDALHPAVLRLIQSVAAAGHACGREVSVCGGLGSDPEAIALLIGLGIREVSAVPNVIPEIKRIIRGLDAGACRELATAALDLTDAAAVRRSVADWTARKTDLESDR